MADGHGTFYRRHLYVPQPSQEHVSFNHNIGAEVGGVETYGSTKEV